MRVGSNNTNAIPNVPHKEALLGVLNERMGDLDKQVEEAMKLLGKLNNKRKSMQDKLDAMQQIWIKLQVHKEPGENHGHGRVQVPMSNGQKMIDFARATGIVDSQAVTINGNKLEGDINNLKNKDLPKIDRETKMQLEFLRTLMDMRKTQIKIVKKGFEEDDNANAEIGRGL